MPERERRFVSVFLTTECSAPRTMSSLRWVLVNSCRETRPVSDLQDPQPHPRSQNRRAVGRAARLQPLGAGRRGLGAEPGAPCPPPQQGESPAPGLTKAQQGPTAVELDFVSFPLPLWGALKH